jgi:anti-sigma factor ChrR (cupin superfamily)
MLAMRLRGFALFAAIVLMPGFTLAQDTKPAAKEPAARPAVVTPDQRVWKPLIPGVESAVVSGDPDKKGGVYVIRIRSKGDAKVPRHWHVTDEHVTVLAGSFLVAHGDKNDAAKLIELKAGAHAVIPATMPHFGLHKNGPSSSTS